MLSSHVVEAAVRAVEEAVAAFRSQLEGNADADLGAGLRRAVSVVMLCLSLCSRASERVSGRTE